MKTKIARAGWGNPIINLDSGLRRNDGRKMVKLNELSELQRSHMAWRLDRYTSCGYLKVLSICRLETHFNDKEVCDVFKTYALTDRMARHHAKRVHQFSLRQGKLKKWALRFSDAAVYWWEIIGWSPILAVAVFVIPYSWYYWKYYYK